MPRTIRRLLVSIVIVAAFGAAVFFLVRYRTLDGRAATLRRAGSALAQGRNAEVHLRLRTLLWFCPDDGEALRLSGLAWAQQGDYPTAIRTFTKIAPESAVFQTSQLELVTVLQADYQMESQENVLPEYLERFPDQIHAVLRLAGLLKAQSRTEEAIAIIRSLIGRPAFGEFTPDDQLSVLIPLAGIQFDPPQPDAILPQLLMSLQRHPAQRTVMLAVGEAYVRMGNPEEAIPILREAQQLEGSSVCGSAAYAEALILSNDLKSANGVLKCLTEQHKAETSPEYAELWARWFEASGQFENAVIERKKAISLKPGHSSLHAALGRLYQRIQRLEEAAAEHRQAHELAQAELAVWKAARSFPDYPTESDCRRMADLYRRLNCWPETTVWQNLATGLTKPRARGAFIGHVVPAVETS
ncbi:MAG: tetratricopeptide repeat protein [Planctomycetaceae bacterium]|nr:tetratricopeptide repeat protein [Planctomycetaceae bacterium]